MANKSAVEINGIEDFEKVKDRWKRAESGKDMTAFQSYEWNKLLYLEWKNYKYNRIFSKIEVFVVEADAGVMIFPALVQEHNSSIKALFGRKPGVYLLGQGSYSDYLNVVYDAFSETLFSELMGFVRERYPELTIYFSNIREDTSTYQSLSAKYQSANSTVSVYVDVPEKCEELDASLSKHTRQNLRTALNRMNKDAMQYEWHMEGKIEDEETLDILGQLHRDRIKTKNHGDSDLKYRFISWIILRQMLYKEKNNNIVRRSMCTMENSFAVIVKLKGKTAGYIYGLKERNGVIRILQNCVNEEYAFYSPMFRGIYDCMLKNCGRDEFKQLDFTRGDEAYKYKLGGKALRLFDFVIRDWS